MTSPAYAFQSSVGEVQGKVVLDSDGSAVSGVTIALVQTSTTPRATPMNPVNSGTVTTTPISTVSAPGTAPISSPTAATAISANDGSFNASGLSTGQFAVCVKDPSGSVIDPCLWTDSLTTVKVTAGSLSSGLLVRVKKASTVSVQVNDTAQALVQQPTDAHPPHILVGAFDARGGFHPARQQKTSAGINYQLAIPVDSPIRVSIYSAQVQLETGASVAVPAKGYSTTFVQPSSQSQTTSFTFNAVGRN
jgi:hypothetical protein